MRFSAASRYGPAGTRVSTIRFSAAKDSDDQSQIRRSPQPMPFDFCSMTGS
jgi:hypothetical protein